MVEVISLMAKMMPLEKLAQDVKDAKTEWLLIPNKDNKDRMVLCSTLLFVHLSTEKKDVHEVMTQIKDHQDGQNIIQKMKGGN